MILLISLTTLFPYTTLFRSLNATVHRLTQRKRRFVVEHRDGFGAELFRLRGKQFKIGVRGQTDHLEVVGHLADDVEGVDADGRSEEHTSELQSQFHLVCRLL